MEEKDDFLLPVREFQPLHIDETVLNFTKQNAPLHLRNVEQADRKGESELVSSPRGLSVKRQSDLKREIWRFLCMYIDNDLAEDLLDYANYAMTCTVIFLCVQLLF